MAYNINYTDSTNKGTITVEDGTVNQETSLGLPGRNSTAYGTVVAENFLHLLENFANATAPSNPVEGQLWFDTTPGVEQLKVYDGTTWTAAGGLKKAEEQPDAANSIVGDLWVDTDNQQLYLFSGSGWILVGPEFSQGLKTGASPDQIIGTDNITYNVIRVEVAAQTIAIISSDQFTPKTVISGFTQIKPGINLTASNISGSGIPKFIGTSEKAENLIVAGVAVPASNFLRSDQISTTDFGIKVKNNSGVVIGTGNQLTLGVEGNTGLVQHNLPGASIDFRVNNDGVQKTAIRLDATGNVGVNNPDPDETLDVQGTLGVSDNIFLNGLDQSTTFGNGALVVKGGVGIARNLNVGGDLKLTGNFVTANIVPDLNNNRNIGNELTKYDRMYANNFVGNLIGNVSGTVSGRAGSADKLSGSTNFTLSGDVSSNTIVFDGQTGGTNKIFTTEISNSFISTKEASATTQLDDEIIINRVSGDTGLKKVTARSILNEIPIAPTGMIVPFAGASEPNPQDVGGGTWLLCDGREVEQAEYPELFDVIGFQFKDATQISDGGFEFFALPDLRGRLPLGLDNMGGTDADVVTGLRAEELGNTGGSEKTQIRKENLPEHEHDMQADNGDQFYSISAVTKNAGSDPESIVYPSPTGTGAGQGLASSGGIAGYTPTTTEVVNQENVDLGSKIDVMNPFLALNYLIYTGKRQ